ncbi:MAG: GAF domain-containing protein [Drouetiella hepatica Uher 2000/2452]|uniref:Circadian input-output histidine kinase CikA n=1 Tax=Drouetiella hepatica Uher 2000/2452 TaxID=904376 RepID=A0A951QB18_9CYAN|nr:GAF domain-containing protein [Drouetiella hepatica Uher 2000/2452]
MKETFAPVAIAPYLKWVHQVLDYLIPIRFEYPFEYAGKYLIFDLTISPVLMPHGTATTAVAMGQFLGSASREKALEMVNTLVHSSIFPRADRYHKRLTQVVWNIRRSLDLKTIWQQTVDELGEALGVSRCLIFPYKPSSTQLRAVAEFHQPSLESLSDLELTVAEETYVGQALLTLKPVIVSDRAVLEPVFGCELKPAAEERRIAEERRTGTPSILAIATCYQDQPNGLIILYQADPARIWSDVEIDLLREIAEQVGTGVAHATLLEESRSLAGELQRVNDSLMQQHQELEEARRLAEAASRLKSDFLANTSHELRTPLNGMIGFLKLIMDGMVDDPEEQSQFIEEAHGSAIHLLHLINDILDIAKIEAGKMQLELNPVKLDDLMTAVENFTRPQARQKNLSFEIRTPETHDEVILYGNYQRLLQVMFNLVVNAIKFTHQGNITITAEVIPGKIVVQNEEMPGIVKISVADTGIGVSLEKQDKLFQSFSQVDGSRTRQYGGTGLGLAISQKLVEDMGGVVNFISLGEGLCCVAAHNKEFNQTQAQSAVNDSRIFRISR